MRKPHNITGPKMPPGGRRGGGGDGCLVIFFAFAVAIAVACGVKFPIPDPIPKPTPTPPPVCDELQSIPWCHEEVPPLECGECKHQPEGETCPVMAPACPLPQPQCDPWRVCDCYPLRGDFIQCPDAPVDGECKDIESLLVDIGDCGNPFRTRIKVATSRLGDLTGGDPQENLKLLASKLQELNPELCAFGGIEAIFIAHESGLWEEVWVEYHAVHFGTGGWTESGFGKWVGCHRAECASPDPTGLEAEFVLKQHGNRWDSTYRVRSYVYCTEAGFTGRTWCPLRNEGDVTREVCERKHIGDQLWFCNGDPIESTDNPAQAKCYGTVRTCTEDLRTCAEATWQ